MRSVVSVKDILEDANKVEHCPICNDGPLLVVQSTINFCKNKSDVKIAKIGLCPTHGPVGIERKLKAVRLLGRDAETV
jgi:hypothetical protein